MSTDLMEKLVPRTLKPVLGLLQTVRPVLPGTDATLRDGVPLLSAVGVHGCDWQLRWENWGTSVSAGNAAGNFLRLNFVAPDQEQLGGAGGTDSSRVLSNPYPRPCQAGTEKAGK